MARLLALGSCTFNSTIMNPHCSHMAMSQASGSTFKFLLLPVGHTWPSGVHRHAMPWCSHRCPDHCPCHRQCLVGEGGCWRRHSDRDQTRARASLHQHHTRGLRLPRGVCQERCIHAGTQRSREEVQERGREDGGRWRRRMTEMKYTTVRSEREGTTGYAYLEHVGTCVYVHVHEYT